jgi:integrase
LAIEEKRIPHELCPEFKLLPEDNTRVGFFEQPEFDRVLIHLPEWLEGPTELAYLTGMRKGEILRLGWERVSLVDRLVFLEKRDTKNQQPRILPLNDELYAVFQRAAARRWEGCPYVFHHQGKPIGDFRKAWCEACVQAGVGRWIPVEGRKKPRYSGRLFHDFRRSGCRNLIRSGVPQSVAMKISGHKTNSIFSRYNITDVRDIVEAMRKVSEYERRKREERAERERAPEPASAKPTIQ